MIFYSYIFLIALIFTFLHKSSTDKNRELVYPECGLITPSPLSIGLLFFVRINNTSDKNDYDVEITPDQCCLQEEGDIDCNSLQIIGGCTDYIPKGETKTIKVVAPLLNQYERIGSCSIYVDSKSKIGRNKRDTIKIKFNTTFDRNKSDYLNDYKHCKNIDEDPFNDCKPVNCDTHYNGVKPYFSRKFKRCVAVPTCIKYDDFDYPNIIYHPQTNQCFEESILNEDFEYIKKLSKDDGNKRKSKNVLIINKFNPNVTQHAFLDSDILIDDIETTTKCEHKNITVNKLSAMHSKMIQFKKPNCMKLFLKKYFVDNKWTLLILVLVIIVQCILIFTMIYCLSKSCSCCKDKKVIRKFFNYRQDVSVTTPLITTSNIDTETVDYQYVTESSNNADQKIKCYKACQKEINNNVHKSMSDDILSKLLNRRDWKKKSQVNPETETKLEEQRKHIPEFNQIDNLQSNANKTSILNETKVVIEDEKPNNIMYKNQSRLVNVVNEPKNSNETRDNPEFESNISSEKEIKCHSYNRFEGGVAGFRANVALNPSVFRNGNPKKGTASNSTEKGAQAYFSNDSIDELLSERGVIYLAGENMSKYTFSTGSNDMKPSMTSSISSKTSKNFVKNVLSLLRKRSKQGPSSDPGQNKHVDLELIHMSRASVYSSTNDSDCIKNLKRKDSKTYF